MSRLFTISFSLALVLLLFSTVTPAAGNSIGECLVCHEEIYVRASSYSKIHTVVRDGCTKCHYQEIMKDRSMKMASTNFRKDMIFLLGDLTEENKTHMIQINARDTDGNMARSVLINTGNEEVLNYPGELYELKEISDIRTEKVEKKIFAKAVISWNTNVPTASRIEYGTSKKQRKTLTSNRTYSREHKAVLTGLRHKSRYTFTITSRDMTGKTLRSEEQIFDTTRAFDLTSKDAGPANDPDLKPGIDETALMNIGDRKDVFIKILSNEPVEFRLSVNEIEEEGAKPCDKFVQTRSSTIMVCTECHAHGSSHPVDIRADRQDIKTPEDLPTIDNGLITCVTCHFAHGSETDYFLRTKVSKDLCIKCHPEHNGDYPGQQG